MRVRSLGITVAVVSTALALVFAATTDGFASYHKAMAAAKINPCAAKTINPCAAKTLNPCAAKTLNPCAAKTLNPCAAKVLNPCCAKTLSAEQAKVINVCAAKSPTCGKLEPISKMHREAGPRNRLSAILQL